MRTNIILIIALVFLASCVDGTHELYSPDRAIKVEVLLPSEEKQNMLAFNVYKNDSLISVNNELGLKLNRELGTFHKNVRVLSFRQFYIDNVVETSQGSTKHQANGIRFMLANMDGENLDVVFRIYNNAIAYQYELYNDSLDILMEEHSRFNVDLESGIQAFALSDSLLASPQIKVNNGDAIVYLTNSFNTPLPPRYVTPWRFLQLDQNVQNTEELLLTQTEFAY